ncbi:hypothetical protein NDU88_000785 [Pleurodeles waltl]|uniref:Uncharacterized protein n=1 Tax=Pleurodeles waltl TaxID=8319 RepID=A0AAV7LE16_PLEWA|nr:hypothetical protein NDU88_000785 [Pleurodeles waltl]
MTPGAVGRGKPLRLQLKGAASPPWQGLQRRVASRHGSSGAPLLVSPLGPRDRGVESVPEALLNILHLFLAVSKGQPGLGRRGSTLPDGSGPSRL